MIACELIQFNCFNLSVKLDIIYLSRGISCDNTGCGSIPGQIEIIIVMDRSGKKCIGAYPCIAFPVENIGPEPVAKNQKILVPDPEMIYRLGYFTFRLPKGPAFTSAPSLV